MKRYTEEQVDRMLNDVRAITMHASVTAALMHFKPQEFPDEFYQSAVRAMLGDEDISDWAKAVFENAFNVAMICLTTEG